MKNLNEIYEKMLNGETDCIDGRDLSRLVKFLSVEQIEKCKFKFSSEESKQNYKPIEFTKEIILSELESDLDFAFDKALGQRGISAGMMNEVIKMWLWVLDDELTNFNEYAQYGLPLLKKVAVKYGFHNRIGEDYGNEY